MGETCYIVNASKKETLRFFHVDASKARELAGNPASAAITTWYLNSNRGDLITFVGDHDDSTKLAFGLSHREISSWPDKTDEVVEDLIKEGILKDQGILYKDDFEPESVYIRDLRNCWYDC